jgi:hypothetical protein
MNTYSELIRQFNQEGRGLRFGQWFSIHYITKEDMRTYDFWDCKDDYRLVVQWLEDHGYTETMPPKIESRYKEI